MCWRIKSRKVPEAKVARRDIKVIKLVWREGLLSLYEDFPYKVGNTYCLPEELKDDMGKLYHDKFYYITIHKGFHSYSTKVKLTKAKGTDVYYIDGENCNLPYRKGRKWDFVLLECIIPRGATYYYNKREGHYVSDTIYIAGTRNVEEIELWNPRKKK